MFGSLFTLVICTSRCATPFLNYCEMLPLPRTVSVAVLPSRPWFVALTQSHALCSHCQQQMCVGGGGKGWWGGGGEEERGSGGRRDEEAASGVYRSVWMWCVEEARWCGGVGGVKWLAERSLRRFRSPTPFVGTTAKWIVIFLYRCPFGYTWTNFTTRVFESWASLKPCTSNITTMWAGSLTPRQNAWGWCYVFEQRRVHHEWVFRNDHTHGRAPCRCGRAAQRAALIRRCARPPGTPIVQKRPM